MTTERRDDRGATLVEAALVYALLFLALFAVVEFGLAFKDWLSVSHAAREGARAGATYGNDPAADIQMLRDVERTLAPAGIGNGMNVRVFKASGPGAGEVYSYAPGTDCGDNSPVGASTVGAATGSPVRNRSGTTYHVVPCGTRRSGRSARCSTRSGWRCSSAING